MKKTLLYPLLIFCLFTTFIVSKTVKAYTLQDIQIIPQGNDLSGNGLLDLVQNPDKIKKQAISTKHTKDNGIIVAGTINSMKNNKIEIDIWIAKYDKHGKKEWEKTYGGSLTDSAFMIEQIDDGGYILGAESMSDDGDITPYFLKFGRTYTPFILVLKLDSNGNIQYGNSFGSSMEDNINSIHQTKDGGYILSGMTGTNIMFDNVHKFKNIPIPSGEKYDSAKSWVIKLDSELKPTWQTFIGFANSNAFTLVNDLKQASDGGYVMIGRLKDENYTGLKFYYVVKMDDKGKVLWKLSLDNLDIANAGDSLKLNDIINTSDGNYLVTGAISTSSSSKADLLVLKISPNGDIIWNTRFGGQGEEIGYTIAESSSSYIIGASVREFTLLPAFLTGYHQIFGNPMYIFGGTADILIANLDKKSGNLTYKCYGGTENDFIVDYAYFEILKNSTYSNYGDMIKVYDDGSYKIIGTSLGSSDGDLTNKNEQKSNAIILLNIQGEKNEIIPTNYDYREMNIAKDKSEFKIKFSKELKVSTINSTNIFLADDENGFNKISYPSDVYMKENGLSKTEVVVKSPENGFVTGKKYYLFILKKVTSLDEKNIKNSMRVTLNIN